MISRESGSSQGLIEVRITRDILAQPFTWSRQGDKVVSLGQFIATNFPDHAKTMELRPHAGSPLPGVNDLTDEERRKVVVARINSYKNHDTYSAHTLMLRDRKYSLDEQLNEVADDTPMGREIIRIEIEGIKPLEESVKNGTLAVLQH